MRDKISFLMLTHQGSHTRQLVTSRKTIRILSLTVVGILVGALALGGYILSDYRHLKKSVAEIALLENQITTQKEALAGQHRQIESFVNKINLLKKELVSLKEYESRVREISNIKDVKTDVENGVEKRENIFGVGGPLPEDIDTNVKLKERHSQLIDKMHLQTDQLKLASLQQEKNVKELINDLLKKQKKMAFTPSIRPVNGTTTSKFGRRWSAFSKKKEFHKGFDIGAPKGAPIVATADGMVIFSGRRSSFGNVVVIDHGYGYCTHYAHASKLLKKKGDWVKKGDVIALVGSTGRSTGPHVHYEVHKHGVPVNPENFFLN